MIWVEPYSMIKLANPEKVLALLIVDNSQPPPEAQICQKWVFFFTCWYNPQVGNSHFQFCLPFRPFFRFPSRKWKRKQFKHRPSMRGEPSRRTCALARRKYSRSLSAIPSQGVFSLSPDSVDIRITTHCQTSLSLPAGIVYHFRLNYHPRIRAGSGGATN
jgi:hypothetical protein